MKILTIKRSSTFILVLSLASALFMVTATLFINVYRFDMSFQGGREVVVFYEKGAVSSVTSLLPVYFADLLRMVEGVKVVSPEAVALCYVEGEPVVVRGVNPLFFYGVVEVEGAKLSPNDVFSAVLGVDLAERLGIKTGDKVLVFSGLRERFIELNVKGVFNSPPPFKDEMLVPLYTGQWLRGTRCNYVSLLRVKIGGVINRETLIRMVTGTHRVEVTLKREENLSPVQGGTVLIYNSLRNLCSKGVTDDFGRCIFNLTIGTYYLYPVIGNKTVEEPVKFNVSKDKELTVFLPLNLTGEPPREKGGSESKGGGVREYRYLFRGVKGGLSITFKKGDVKQFLEEKIGVTEAFLWLLAASVLIFSAMTINQASSSLIGDVEQVIHVLRDIGASKKHVLRRILPELTFFSFLGGVLGCSLGTLMVCFSFPSLLVFSHRVEFSIDPRVELMTLLLAVAIGTFNGYLSIHKVLGR